LQQPLQLGGQVPPQPSLVEAARQSVGQTLSHWQVPPWQLSPMMQFELLLQLTGQLAVPPLHKYGEQLGVPAEPAARSVQLPPVQTSQLPEQGVLQQTPSTQYPEEHWLTCVQPVPFPTLQSMSWAEAQAAVQGVQADGQKPSAVPLHGRAAVVHRKVQLATRPVRVRMVLASPKQASDWVWQADGGSHFSPDSTTEFPHTGMQLLSLLALHPVAQHMSPFVQEVTKVEFTQRAVHAVAVPCRVRSWQPIGGQLLGQFPSQNSLQAASVTPLPHWQLQSLSLTLVQPDAQQPSPFAQVAITVSFTHSAVHAAAVPCSRRRWQPIAGQVVGQFPSHFSPASTTPLPQRIAQSLSLALLQVAGQQPSPWAQAVWVPSSVQRAVQAAALPVRSFLMHPVHGQVAGQLETGSHDSPVSIAPFPQRGVQSLSLLALQTGGQQPSPFTHAVWVFPFTHSAVQAAAVPCSRRSWQPTGGQLVGQLAPSHFSLQAASVTPFPHLQVQSLSVARLQLAGQHSSPPTQAVTLVLFTHSALHAAAVPWSLRSWQPIARQLVGQSAPSHFSPASVTPFPHLAVQSLSSVALQVGGQQPSPLRHIVCRRSVTHWARQVPGLATRRSVHPCWGHEVGQLDRGSQTSPQDVSIISLPQTQLQSVSVEAQPAGQQPSPDTHAVCSPLSAQVALQVAAAPRSSYVSQPTCAQLVGQLAIGSQVSPWSSRPFPHTAAGVSFRESTGLSTPASRTTSSMCWTEASFRRAAQPLSLQQTLTPLTAPGIDSQV
jgi:hypothetical protein